MEVVYGVIIALSIMGLWFLFGFVILSCVNFLNMYFKGQRMFEKYDPCHPAVLFGPLMFVWILYPLWLLIQGIYKYLYENLGRTVVVENTTKYSMDYKHTCLSKSSTRNLYNFFSTYIEKDIRINFNSGADKEALENFFRVDGWRNVRDGVWTKIVKVKDLNTGA